MICLYNEQVLVEAKRMQDQAGKLLQHYADEDGAFAQEKVRARAGDGTCTVLCRLLPHALFRRGI
jgi:hypothetical protein